VKQSEGNKLLGMAVPFVEDGHIVYDHDHDTAEEYGGRAGI